MRDYGRGRSRGQGRAGFVAISALALFAMPAPASASGAALLDQARAAARSDRNAEAAKLFAAHLAANPGSRREILGEYADQLLYSNRPDQAAALLREVLQWDLAADERIQARKGYALALLWSDRHRAAAQAYASLLADRPDDTDLALNQVRAVQWMGRPDTAAAMLGALPTDLREAGAGILADIRRNARPLTEASFAGFSQADGLDLTRWQARQQIFALSGAASLQASFERRRFDDGAEGRVTIDSPALSGNWRASDWLQVSGQAGLERQRGSGVSRSLFTYEASAALLPADNVRLDFVTARRSLDNLTSLRLGVTTRHYFASLDYWPDSLFKLTLRGELTRFSDGNDRQWVQLEAERRLSRSPNLFVGVRATAFRFDEQLDHGYFNPRSFRSVQATARGWSRIGSRTWLDLSVAAGPEDSTPGGTRLAYWARGKLSQGLGDRLELSITAERLSAGQTATGFARNSISAALRLRW